MKMMVLSFAVLVALIALAMPQQLLATSITMAIAGVALGCAALILWECIKSSTNSESDQK